MKRWEYGQFSYGGPGRGRLMRVVFSHRSTWEPTGEDFWQVLRRLGEEVVSVNRDGPVEYYFLKRPFE